jgi:hypothetical protein
MNRHQRMKNRETARRLRQWVKAPTISISSVGVDLGAPGGDFSATAWVQAGRVVNFHLTSGSVDFLPHAVDLRFEAVQITEGNAA